ncbi:MAG: hypothetical protein Q3972_06305, partial [Corynebacterium sp.]|nr:hypothetical protein [Corynebacterium sp.]
TQPETQPETKPETEATPVATVSADAVEPGSTVTVTLENVADGEYEYTLVRTNAEDGTETVVKATVTVVDGVATITIPVELVTGDYVLNLGGAEVSLVVAKPTLDQVSPAKQGFLAKVGAFLKKNKLWLIILLILGVLGGGAKVAIDEGIIVLP